MNRPQVGNLIKVTSKGHPYKGVLGEYIGRVKGGEYNNGLKVRYPIHELIGGYEIIHPKQSYKIYKR